jgi:hypothetical protein
MNDEQIKQCIKNAISHYEYAVLWYNRNTGH